MALAFAGDYSRSLALANDLEKQLTTRAVLALKHRDPAKAVELLQVAVAYELSVPRSSLQGFFGALYPVYVRGLSYLAAYDGIQAANEFQKWRPTPLVPWRTCNWEGRTYVLTGDKVRAKSAYQEFLQLWKNADPDIPILRQAETEYAKLSLSGENSLSLFPHSG